MKRSKTITRDAILFVMFVMMISSLITWLLMYILHLLKLIPNLKYATVTLPFLALAVSILIGVFVSAFVSKKILRPLQKLVSGIRNVEKGDFTARVDPGDTKGEVKELIDSFNSMTKELSGIEIFRNDFINTFSHEFKTPIVSIRGFAKQLKLDSLTEEERNEYADIIITESERLANMSSNILLLSKLENQQFISDRSLYSLDEQLRSCILLLQRQWEEKKLNLYIEIDNITYFGNAEIMSHIWMNLLGNAVKFCPAGGNISVKCYRKEDHIHVIITNDGQGLNQDTLNHIFDKFYQGDSSHTSKGNGLGLPLVKRIVYLCGGYITVISDNTSGTSFHIEIPLLTSINGDQK